MSLVEARRFADEVVERLAPYCERIEVAGSIRRERPTIGDIEIVCIPQTVEVANGFFDNKHIRHPGFITAVQQWKRVRGLPTGKYTQRILPAGAKLDVFMASDDNWGLILAIRTGSARFSHEVLARSWVRSGFHSIGGHLVRERTGYQPDVRSEEELFELIGLDWVAPWDRE